MYIQVSYQARGGCGLYISKVFCFVGICAFVGSVAGTGQQECLVLGAALMLGWDGPSVR